MIEAVQRRIDINARNIGYSEREIQELKEPFAINSYVGETPDGYPVVVERVQHRRDKDGAGGGFNFIEYKPGAVTIEDLQRRARTKALGLGTIMSLKRWLVRVQLAQGIGENVGGAKGVLVVPEGTLPNHYNPNRDRLDPILEDYVDVQTEKGLIGIGIDRHAPDVSSGPRDMDLMANRHVMRTGDERSIAAFSGKSLENHGLAGREISTPKGLVDMLRRHMGTLGMNPLETTVAVQGAGNVGYHFAHLAQEHLGVKIVAISDKNHAVVGSADQPLRFGETITVEDREITRWNEDIHRSSNNPRALFDVPADVLVLAALPDSVTADNGVMKQLRTDTLKIILPGANNPMDEETIAYCLAHGISVLSDIDTNKGGFFGSNIEYNQGVTGNIYSEAFVLEALRKCIDEVYDEILEEAGGNPINMVDPAYRMAIKRQYERDHSGLLVPASART